MAFTRVVLRSAATGARGELCNTEYRGRLVGLFQINIVVGIAELSLGMRFHATRRL